MRTASISILLLLLLTSCGAPPSPTTVGEGTASRAHTNQPSPRVGIHTVALPHYQPDLPTAPGRDVFAVACLSCHSERYVTMQPPLTAAKWEESVRKMMKTYGAPITEDQVPQIVKYIVATKEAGANGAWNALATLSRNSPPPKITLATGAAARQLYVQRGQSLYTHACASCHGARGEGDGPGAFAMLPHPSAFTSGRYAPEALATAIANGIPATAMPGYPTLGEEDLRALVTYCDELSRSAPQQPAAAPVAAIDRKVLYSQNCANCHGETGAGDGFVAPTLPRPPANFRTKQPAPQHAMKVISEGVPGTAMPPWSAKLPEPQRAVLADYVRSLFDNHDGR